MRLLVLAGERCITPMDSQMQNLRCRRIQSDEIWTFAGKKKRNLREHDPQQMGDAWVFVALDPETKLIPAYTLGKRNRETTYQFLTSLRTRIAPEHRFQITKDGFHFYRKGVVDVFADQADFAQMIKLYGDYGQHDTAGRYSPSPMIETIVRICDGRPDPRHISTSYIERQNMTIRQSIRRFTRLTNAFSKKLDNLKAACALHFAYYDFCRNTPNLASHSGDGSGLNRSRMDDPRNVFNAALGHYQ
jgi:IS1 family transposase